MTSAEVLKGALYFSAYVAPGIDMMIISFYSSVHMSRSVCLHALLLKRSPLSFLPVLTGMASSTCGCITRGCGPQIPQEQFDTESQKRNMAIVIKDIQNFHEEDRL